jgi:hypothetical protein
MDNLQRSLKLIVAVLLVLCVSSTALAQADLSETFVSEDGSFSFAYPAGWEAIEIDPGVAILNGDELTLTFYGPGYVAESIVTDADDLQGTLKSFLSSGGLHPENLESLTVDDREIATAEVEALAGVGTAFGIIFNDGMGVVQAVIPDESIEDAAPLVLDIVASFGPAEEGDAGSSLAGAVQAAAAASLNVDCSVRTNQERFASLRVGPGTNRTAMLFLPSNRDFDVLGQAEADDGALWWKLDKAQVAPDSAAAELWVDQSQVTATDDCAQVPNVEPPPIIPIVTSSNILPTPGTWNTTTHATRITCPGMGPITVDIEIPDSTASVSTASGGGVLVLDGERLNRTAPGVYVGTFDSPELGGAFTFTLRVVSANQIAAEMSGATQGCDFVLPITLTRG